MEENTAREKWLRFIGTTLALFFTMTVLFFVNGQGVLSNLALDLGYYPNEVCAQIFDRFESDYYYQDAFDQTYQNKKNELLRHSLVQINAIETLIYEVTDGQKDEFTYFIYNDPLRGIDYYDQVVSEHIDDGFYSYSDGNAYGYVRFLSFNEGTSDKVISSIQSFSQSGVKHLILDLRGNGGGLVNEANSIMDTLMEDNATIRMEFNDRSEYVMHSGPGSSQFDKISVLLNGESASASEMIALGLKSQYPESVELLGEKTYGKDVTQSFYEDEDHQFMLMVVDSKWYYQQKGIPELQRMIQRRVMPAYDANHQQYFFKTLSESINEKR